MTNSGARWVLSRLTEAFGANGALVVRKVPESSGPEGQGGPDRSRDPDRPGGSGNADGGDGPDGAGRADGADLVPGSALRRSPCECGGPECPDSAPAGTVNQAVAERNGRGRRGGRCPLRAPGPWTGSGGRRSGRLCGGRGTGSSLCP